MQLVVDASVVFSCLLPEDNSFDIFLINRLEGEYKFVAPEYLFREIGKNFGKIIRKSELPPEELAEVFDFIKGELEFFPFEEFNRFAEEASKISPHKKPKDDPYFALALSLNYGIWSNEKGFKQQDKVEVFNTEDLISRFKELLKE